VTLDQALHALAASNQLPEYGSSPRSRCRRNWRPVSDTLKIGQSSANGWRCASIPARHPGPYSIAILAGLPVFAGGALALINPDYINTLFTDPQGRTAFGAAVTSLTVGIVTMRTIVTRSLS
jgi:hypothetical protein